MHFHGHRRRWVLQKWLNSDDFSRDEQDLLVQFAKHFKMGNLIMFYYIEAHTDRVVASAFCTALFRRKLETQQHNGSFVVNMPKDGSKVLPVSAKYANVFFHEHKLFIVTISVRSQNPGIFSIPPVVKSRKNLLDCPVKIRIFLSGDKECHFL
jgi:hypothetical protein